MRYRVLGALRRSRRAAQRLRALVRQVQHPSDVLLALEAIRLQRQTSAWLARPLPLVMRAITPPAAPCLPLPELERRTRLIDATVQLFRVVPLGFCLRRSLVRYVLLRRAGLPVEIVFGARPEDTGSGSLIGHAWLEFDGAPWMEAPEHLDGYTAMYRYPEPGSRELHTRRAARRRTAN
ncbi:MAG: lasso peptide biosynthesis B2 protein [Ardenticatenaceae bacterium]|nr:lasso peptide biosynthesis B2 protein [Ardenticatenaceae bacterium]